MALAVSRFCFCDFLSVEHNFMQNFQIHVQNIKCFKNIFERTNIENLYLAEIPKIKHMI